MSQPAPLDSRAAELLRLLVERYIADGQPVGSRTLSRAGELDLSPATIRNVMADLDELGLVASPHTSAGRIPTARGYRYFVDQLLTPETLNQSARDQIASALLQSAASPADVLQAASNLLLRLTAMAGVVTVPRKNMALLRRIEFLPLSGNRVLAILVVNEHEVQNRVLRTPRPYGADELEQFANMINEQFAGHDLLNLRRALADEAVAVQHRINVTLREAAAMAAQAMQSDQSGDYVFAGGANLLAFQELADVKRLRGLFEVLDRKRDLLNLFDQCLDAEGVQIFIGEESGYRVLDEMSVVTAPYYVNGEIAGRLSVIGPTRMAYNRIIPLVSETARALSARLDAEN
ncbi:MAG: heat-inducible transcriptional repressor HrcA [Panacagrimonas sp.]